MPRKVILDMDPGVDDALGLCVALASNELEVVAVTATGGNVLPALATRNVQAIIENLDPQRWPRIGAATAEQPLRTDGRDLHGSDGLGGAEFQVAELANRHASIKVISDEIRQAPGEVTVVCSGPLSNLAAVLQREPDIAQAIGQVIVVGGAVACGGNITPAAEFNIYCDAESARDVLRSRITKTLLPLDVTRQLSMRFDLLDLVKQGDGRTARLLDRILPGYYRAYRHRMGMEGIFVHDAVGVVMAMHPELFTTEPMSGDVETAGDLTYGATVFDRRSKPDSQPNMEVVTEMDVAAVRDCLLRGVKG
ncbi:Pyrimidine-specific ribonucleoside hydrolase RihA [Pirellulimonas nuda]|uniref:Pyrimidine-specific ribonucleoside hydrolase RihA n=1 Tax=Pirellulimonas nuda TaxID=2528009 RepID=A0A518D839_9BACT|nr:nucleoside hydrolase [Pirellulimonas nuda]QDU87652.1 Pyrimidine-specific ribonucleoside hydrolase RihA [Pirellulimonas nuda]